MVLATRNADKVAEIRRILRLPAGGLVSLLDYPELPEIDETGLTLEDNALIKAREAHRQTGLPCLADDTGLEVDALKGAPGVFSSRFAGPGATYADNTAKLLRAMEAVQEKNRRARFRCVVALKAGKREEWVEGNLEGVILREARGDGGFGYDPVFFIPQAGKTLAEMTLEEKNAVSHRGAAFRRMAERLAERPV
ncbi:RdgB/HAM1 family non-canonical purine NTP pyrophosphatase [bacterium]|nr:RdgB/HAM1 family non-canonical purine NTP pyrophosphatase [bacterium]